VPASPSLRLFLRAGSGGQVGERRISRLGPYVAQLDPAGGDKVVHQNVHLAKDVAHRDIRAPRPSSAGDRGAKCLRVLSKFAVGTQTSFCECFSERRLRRLGAWLILHALHGPSFAELADD
jgi:hypothetical protein